MKWTLIARSSSVLAWATGIAALLIVGSPTHGAEGAPCDPPVSNPIVCENIKTGSPSSEWDLTNGGEGDPSIQGFATDISVNKGSMVSFKIKTPSTNYRLDIYRMGYYQGDGARRIATVQPSASLPQNQPACLTDASTGLVDCGNWSISASWAVPSNAVSGVYFAKLVREDPENGRDSHIVFVVRDDSSHSPILFQTSDTTWQAYNAYGGSSLYHGSGPAFDGRAYKVSYNRPFSTRGQPGGDGVSNWFFYGEYPMVRWLESNGYDVTYSTGVDSDRRGALIKNHQVFLSVGHDEYWSANQRTNVEQARDSGVSLAFFTGNEVFWKTRWENSIDSSQAAYRTLVSYKETKSGAKIDPNPAWTGTWRDPSLSPPADGGRPENGLTGTIFTVNRGTAEIEVPYEYSRLRLWRNTSIASLTSGQTATLANQTLGYEWDEDLDNGARPPGLIRLSSTTVDVSEHLVDYGNTYVPGTATHHLTLYRAISGALVFGAGTVQWTWGLDTLHDISPDTGPSEPDIRIQQATVNLLADMGVQAGSLEGGLLQTTASTDATKPTSSISSPANGSSVQQEANVTISGSASDLGGGRVGGIEVSTDGGASWHPANGTTSWSYVWKPQAPGSATIRTRAVDDSGNIEIPSAGRTVTVTPRTCPCSVWSSNTVPVTPSSGDANAIEVGMKFKSDVDGYLTGVRFYKGSGNTGSHVGNLWTSTGTLLATGTFSGETSSGWQQLLFPQPVAINGNVTYVVSYHTNSGYYSVDPGGLTTGVHNYPVQALSGGESGGNGVYVYGPSGFPTGSYNSTNYWVDVVFDTTANDMIAPAIIEQTPAAGATQVEPANPIMAKFSEPVTPSTIVFQLRRPDNSVVPATLTYDTAARQSTLTPDTILAESTMYTAQISGATDLGGNQMAQASWNFTTKGPATSIWTGSSTPAVASVNDPYAIEVGLKIRSDVSGYVTGVRFYKGSANTGTHVGNLWSGAGTLLATATFTNETASGWQQVAFSAPVQMTAGTTYVVSYHTDAGYYSLTSQQFSAAGVDNYPLHALSSSAAGGNGVYKYGQSGFPTGSYNGSNYWVDVVFSQTFVDTVPPTILIQSPGSGAANAAPTGTITATFSEPVNAASINFQLSQGTNVIPASVTYDAAARKAVLTPASQLSLGVSYSATISGATDTAGNSMGSPVTWSFTTVTCACTMFSSSSVPAVINSGDASSLELGVKFKSDVGGYVTGVRFYKGSANTGTHVGKLWTASGTLLASATFTNETGSGWQQVNFASPAAITANTTYVVSYYMPNGNYSFDQGFFANETFSWPLHALADSASVGNGVFKYGSGGFPTDSYNATNYWVDAVFIQAFADAVAPEVTSKTPVSGATVVPTTTGVTATFSEPVTASSISFVLKNGSTTVPSTVTYDVATRTATLTPTSQLSFGATYSATVSGARDLANNPMAGPVTWSFTTVNCPCSLWSPTAVPGTTNSGDSSQIEVGLKFKSEISGAITGIRFYKGSSNTGVHVGNLWSATGTLLATGTFANETASGWQQVTFAAPIAISADTTYVVSYYSPNGNYSVSGGYLTNETVSWPLHALANGAAGGNGVYRYGSGGGFPSSSFNATNYWVDVIFSPVATDALPPTVVSESPQSGATSVATTTTVTATFSEAVNSNTLSFTLKSGSVTAPASVTYDAPSRTATLTPNSALSFGTTYTATVSAEDIAGNPMASSRTWSFTTIACPCTIWASSATPSIVAANDGLAIEVGLKFKAAVSGKITGVRFYKGAANTGTHVASLWTSSGALLGTATFTNETASGWQQVDFASPVNITANTTYVVSYYSPNGYYAVTSNYFGSSSTIRWPLEALSAPVSGGNGLFKYGTSAFPTQSFNGGNYWVDVVFTP